MTRIRFIDSTLRDGEQTPGVCFSRVDKLMIATRLDQLGIPEIEAGIPVMGESVQGDIRTIRDLGLKADISVWCRARFEDLDAAEACGVNLVHVALPASDRLLSTMDRDGSWLKDQADAVLRSASRRFPMVSCGLMDASRCSPERLQALTALAVQTGAQRVRLADTVGLWHPAAVTTVFQKLRASFPALTLGFHGHNDLGMATANALAAVLAGANCIDVTVNGLGDRAGNVALAEIVMALELAVGMPTGIDTRQLSQLSKHVAKASGEAIPADKPVVGDRVFQHEAGIHVKGLLRDRLSFQPYIPETVGRHRETMIAGPHSGRTALQYLQVELRPKRNPVFETPKGLCA